MQALCANFLADSKIGDQYLQKKYNEQGQAQSHIALYKQVRYSWRPLFTLFNAHVTHVFLLKSSLLADCRKRTLRLHTLRNVR